MWELPRAIFLTSGCGRGGTKLTAFDNALLDAKIGNMNLVSVSSIVPPGAVVVKNHDIYSHFPPGSLVPVVYSYLASNEVGQTISSAMAIGIPTEQNSPGVIFEVSLSGDAIAAATKARLMVTEAMANRRMSVSRILENGCSITVLKEREFACALVAAVLLNYMP